MLFPAIFVYIVVCVSMRSISAKVIMKVLLLGVVVLELFCKPVLHKPCSTACDRGRYKVIPGMSLLMGTNFESDGI